MSDIFIISEGHSVHLPDIYRQSWREFLKYGAVLAVAGVVAIATGFLLFGRWIYTHDISVPMAVLLYGCLVGIYLLSCRQLHLIGKDFGAYYYWLLKRNAIDHTRDRD